MSFQQFAFHNVKRNIRAYFTYYLSSSFAIMVFFTYCIFIFHPDLSKSDMGMMTRSAMKGASYVTYFFSFLFIFYSIAAFLKARLKEFGILTLLGATGRQLNWLILLENMIIGGAATATGLLGGLVLAKLFLMIGSRIIEIKELGMYFPWEAIGITIGAFLILFLLISLLTQIFVRQRRAFELLQGAKKPKSEPAYSIWLVLVAVCCLGGAFFLVNQKLAQTNFLLMIGLDLIGTYLLFTQLSIFVIRLLKRNRSFFWQRTRLLWVAEMAYKIKDNARMFFMITMVTVMACSAAGTILSVQQVNKQMYQNEKFALTYDLDVGQSQHPGLKYIESKLDKQNIKYQQIMVNGLLVDFQGDSNIAVTSEQEFGKIASLAGLAKSNLQDKKAVFVQARSGKKKDQLVTEKGKISLHVTSQFNNTLLGKNDLVVVSNQMYQQLKNQYPDRKDHFQWAIYDVPAWKHSGVPSPHSLEAKIGVELMHWNREALSKKSDGYLISRAGEYIDLKQSTDVIIFIGLFIAFIFSIFTASFLYFKLDSELTQDQEYYRGLSKMGLSIQEMKRAATIQLLALFFVPIVIAAIQTIVGLQALKESFLVGSIMISAFTAIGGFALAQFIYFLIIRWRYLQHIQKVMV